MRAVLLSTLMITGLAASSAMAEGPSVTAGAALSFTNKTLDGVTSEASAYVEGSFSNFYLGASAYIYKDSASDEVDLSLGYRNTLAGGLSYDVSYTRFMYPNDGGDCCGSVTLSMSLPVGDSLTVTAEGAYYTVDKTDETYLTLDYALNDKVTLTGTIGRYSNVGAADTKEWELAASYALSDATAVTAHYYDGSDYKGYIGLDLSWDTTLLGG